MQIPGSPFRYVCNITLILTHVKVPVYQYTAWTEWHTPVDHTPQYCRLKSGRKKYTFFSNVSGFSLRWLSRPYSSALWHQKHTCPLAGWECSLHYVNWCEPTKAMNQHKIYITRSVHRLRSAGKRFLMLCDMPALPKAPDTIIVRLTATTSSNLLLPQEDLFKFSPTQTILSSCPLRWWCIAIIFFSVCDWWDI